MVTDAWGDFVWGPVFAKLAAECYIDGDVHSAFCIERRHLAVALIATKDKAMEAAAESAVFLLSSRPARVTLAGPISP